MTLEEFKKEIMPLKNKLFGYARRVLNDEEDAEDVVQDAFLKLWNIREQLGTKNNPKAYAMTVCKNLCFDRLRKAKHQMLELDERLVSDKGPAPDRTAVNSDLMGKVEQIVSGLPEKQKMIIHLRDIVGMSYDEMVEVTGMGRNAIKVNLSRARKKVREQLSGEINYGQ